MEKKDGTYTAANGQEITEETIDRWCAAYERGEFPEDEHGEGEIVWGRPPLSCLEKGKGRQGGLVYHANEPLSKSD